MWVLGGADKNLDAGVLGGVDKNVDTEHNAEKEAKVCESNLFWLLLITIGVEGQGCKAISPKHCPPRHRPPLGVIHSADRTTIA